MDLQQLKNRFGIIGNSQKLNYALDTASKVAPTDITVYIQGESGVGKESFSKIIHQLSSRKHGPFISINCGAIPEGTINSELFGHEKGAFTGAVESRKGYFETVDGGTIFLDEVGELPLETQSRLLRILENGEYIKVGSSKVQKTNVRVVTATNKDLFELSQKGKFREDLYFRLSTLPIRVPSLRERPQDILLLFKKFCMDYSDKYHKPYIELSLQAEKLLIEYKWPGNIRQLKNIAEQISVLENESIIDSETLMKYIPNQTSNASLMLSNDKNNDGYSERDLFYKVLFDLKKDLNDLKGIVLNLIEGRNINADFLRNNESNLPIKFNNSNHEELISIAQNQHIRPNISENNHLNNQQDEDELFEPHEMVSTDENLSLDAKEMELIKKALLKNNGKRKKAADELGISERTLYRKIKQYNLDY